MLEIKSQRQASLSVALSTDSFGKHTSLLKETDLRSFLLSLRRNVQLLFEKHLENSFEILQTFVVLEITREGSICVLDSCVTNFAQVCSRLPIQAASQVNIFAPSPPQKILMGHSPTI